MPYYINVDLVSFNYQFAYYSIRFVSPPSKTKNFNAPDYFNPYLTSKCMFGIAYYWIDKASNPKKIDISTSGTV